MGKLTEGDAQEDSERVMRRFRDGLELTHCWPRDLRTHIAALEADLALNAGMLARQTDLAREAENEAATARAQAEALARAVDPECSQEEYDPDSSDCVTCYSAQRCIALAKYREAKR